MFLVLLQNNSTERLWCSALFLGEFLESDALELGSCSLGALRHDLSTPWLSDFFGTFVVVGVDGFNQFAQSRSVFSVDIGQSNTRTVLEANKSSKSGFTLDNAIWNTHSAAKSWKEENNFNWINISIKSISKANWNHFQVRCSEINPASKFVVKSTSLNNESVKSSKSEV